MNVGEIFRNRVGNTIKGGKNTVHRGRNIVNREVNIYERR